MFQIQSLGIDLDVLVNDALRYSVAIMHLSSIKKIYWCVAHPVNNPFLGRVTC